jgi:hypothetical protein
VLAGRRALRLLGFPGADLPAAGPHSDDLPPGPRNAPRAHERGSSRAGHAVLVRRFRRPLRGRHAGDRHRRHQDRTVRHARHVRHPAQRGAACRRALPPRRLRWSQGRLGAQRQGERLHPGHCGDGCRGDRSQPPRQGAAAPLHRRRCGRLHHAVDGNHHLSAESGAVEQGGLCRKPPMVSRDIFRRPARGQAGFSKSILLDGKVILRTATRHTARRETPARVPRRGDNRTGSRASVRRTGSRREIDEAAW